MTAPRFAAALAAVVALSTASAAVPQPFPRATPESQGVPSEAVLGLVERLHAEGDWVHAYMLIRGGKWARGELEAEKHSALTLSRVPGGKQPVGVSGGWTSPTELKVRICFVRSPAIVDVILDCGGDAVSVRTECQLFKRYRHPAEK